MIPTLVFWCVSLCGLVGLLAYWVRRFEIGHRDRMARLDAAIAASEAARARDREEAAALSARIDALRAELAEAVAEQERLEAEWADDQSAAPAGER